MNYCMVLFYYPTVAVAIPKADIKRERQTNCGMPPQENHILALFGAEVVE